MRVGLGRAAVIPCSVTGEPPPPVLGGVEEGERRENCRGERERERERETERERDRER